MKSRVTWTGEKAFLGQTEDGFSVVLGTATETAPKPGPSTMELVLIGAGGCSTWDVVNILQKARQQVDDVIVELDADRASEPPKVFTRIHMHFVVKGRELSEDHVKRAIELSVEKYCSATKMLEQTAVVSHNFEIAETG